MLILDSMKLKKLSFCYLILLLSVSCAEFGKQRRKEDLPQNNYKNTDEKPAFTFADANRKKSVLTQSHPESKKALACFRSESALAIEKYCNNHELTFLASYKDLTIDYQKILSRVIYEEDWQFAEFEKILKQIPLNELSFFAPIKYIYLGDFKGSPRGHFHPSRGELFVNGYLLAVTSEQKAKYGETAVRVAKLGKGWKFEFQTFFRPRDSLSQDLAAFSAHNGAYFAQKDLAFLNVLTHEASHAWDYSVFSGFLKQKDISYVKFSDANSKDFKVPKNIQSAVKHTLGFQLTKIELSEAKSLGAKDLAVHFEASQFATLYGQLSPMEDFAESLGNFVFTRWTGMALGVEIHDVEKSPDENDSFSSQRNSAEHGTKGVKKLIFTQSDRILQPQVAKHAERNIRLISPLLYLLDGD